MKAQRAIELGDFTLNIFLQNNGEYAITVADLASAVNIPMSDLHDFLYREGYAPTVKAIDIEDAMMLWAEMAAAGNRKAFAILVATAIECIERRADVNRRS